MTESIWITGIGLVSSLGEGPEIHRAALAGRAPVVDDTSFAPYPIHPLPALELDRQIPKRGDQRQMEPWQRLGTYAAGLALDQAGARGCVADMHLVVAAGGGERDTALDEAVCAEIARLPAGEAGERLNALLASGLRPTLFLAQLSNLLAGNISIVHGVTGSSRTLMGEEAAGADAVRIAAARLAEGRGGIALVGGAYVAGRWDMLLLHAASGELRRGPWVPLAERPADGPGLVTGSAAAFLVLETETHARGRGAGGLARLGPVRSGAARRTAEDTAEASAAALARDLPLRPGHVVLSGASGAAAAGLAEARFLAGLRAGGAAPGPVIHSADLIGHAVEAGFPASLALATLAVAAGDAPQALVTGFGAWRGEALALVEPVA
ncbi:beta-ketoacyl-ACP synthase [Roseicella frigidaeris]|uniref:Beta-ketoacyl-ACP synthase n=1 Tax=Roseicella frigidaeris TaxID=2230885 RepID=A0A327M8G7_9PROT|nr:beta-ketoacyl-ACP synthase [Roseicella frigidaeris]RAI58622.1 beta-ketoacyl-ACP synthase [Roseicella frigidaeris]